MIKTNKWRKGEVGGEVSEQKGDIMLTGLRQQSPSGISLPLTDVRHLSAIKHSQQEDFQLGAAGGA